VEEFSKKRGSEYRHSDLVAGRLTKKTKEEKDKTTRGKKIDI